VLLVFTTASLGEVVAHCYITNPEDMLWSFMSAQTAPNPLLDLCVLHSLASWCQFQKTAHNFPELLVLDSHYARFDDGAMGNQPVLDFSREDVLAAWEE
jgi:hypothetical protein